MLTKNEEETKKLAKNLARTFKGGEVVALKGELGAGKTIFTQGLAEGLGARIRVKSPTFTLIREYQGDKLKLYHIDCWRLKDSKALLKLGFLAFLNNQSVLAIEWADKLKSLLPKNTIWVKIDSTKENNRKILINYNEVSNH